MTAEPLQTTKVSDLPRGTVLQSSDAADLAALLENDAKLQAELRTTQIAAAGSAIVAKVTGIPIGPYTSTPPGTQPNYKIEQAARSAALSTARTLDASAALLEEQAANLHNEAQTQSKIAIEGRRLGGFGPGNNMAQQIAATAEAEAARNFRLAIGKETIAALNRRDAATLRNVAETPNTVVSGKTRINPAPATLLTGTAAASVTAIIGLKEVFRIEAAIAEQQKTIVVLQLATGVAVKDLYAPTQIFAPVTTVIADYQRIVAQQNPRAAGPRFSDLGGAPTHLNQFSNFGPFIPKQSLSPSEQQQVVALLGSLPPQYATETMSEVSSTPTPPIVPGSHVPPLPLSPQDAELIAKRVAARALQVVGTVGPIVRRVHILLQNGVDP